MSALAGSEEEVPGGATSMVVLVRRLVLVAALLGMLVLAGWPAVQAVADWRLPDNDDAMRVAQVRDWLAGQSWWDVRQHRIAPLDGGDMHWSRLADLPLAALAAPLGLVLGPQAGLQVATFMAPLLLGLICIVLTSVTASRLATPGLARQTAMIAAVPLALLAFPAMSWFMPGRVDHHGLQLVLVMGALAGLAGGGARGAALAGLMVATSLLIGLETAPVLVILTGYVALRWIVRGAEARSQALSFSVALGVALPALFAATVPADAWGSRIHDAFSVIHLVPALAGAAGLALIVLAASGRGIGIRLMLSAGVALAVAGAALPFPELLRGPYDLLDPLLARLWLSRVGEALPATTALMSSEAGMAVAFAVPGILACGAGVLLVRAGLRKGAQSEDPEHGNRLDMACLVLALVALTTALSWVWQLRVAGQSAALAALAVAPLLGQMLASHGRKGLLATILLASPLMPGALGVTLAQLMPQQDSDSAGTGQANPTKTASQCSGAAAFAPLAGLSPTLAVTPIDVGARLILVTPHTALAAPYHRNNRSLAAAYRLFLAFPDAAQAQVEQLDAGIVVICSSSPETGMLAEEAPDGLMAMLAAGNAPAWLAPLPSAEGSGIKAWRVLR